MSLVEGVVGSINAILKTLECAICLELLKTPVTTGCGHFFCKFCITKVLKSNYRSPCPLCKKPFTRRSIQEACQRQSVIQAAKELAEACGKFTGLKFFSKESCDAENKNKDSSSLSSAKKSTNVQGSSNSKKRKSHESETSDSNFEELADQAKERNRKSVDSVIEDSNSVSTNDEVIPSTNKRHCQSRAQSDDDMLEFPSLEDILKSKTPSIEKQKSDGMGSSKNHSKISPVVLMRRVSDSEVDAKCSHRKTLEEDISVIPDTNISTDVTMSNASSRSDIEKIDVDVLVLNENVSGKIIKSKEKVLLNNPGAKFQSRLSNKNDKIALTNKTNQLNLKKQEVIENTNKNKETADECQMSAEELVKENKKTDVELFLSPSITVAKRDNTELSSRPGTSKGRKIPRKGLSRLSNTSQKLTSQAANSSTEEDILISKLNEAKNFSLTILNVHSKTSSVDTQKNSNEKVCLNLVETNLPPVSKEIKLTSEPQKELIRLDEITDTAVSVQNVESPEAAKIDLVMKSPGWSKVKQVGKDFRVRKFSRLHVEKNTSNSCPSEVLAIELDYLSNEPATEPVNDKKLLRTSDPIAVDYEKQGTGSTKRVELPVSTFNDKDKNLKKAADSNTCSSLSQNDEVTIGYEVVNDDCCMMDDEMPILINETGKVSDHEEISCDDQGTKLQSPIQVEKSGLLEGKKKCDILFENMPQPICKIAEKITDVQNEMSSSAILNTYSNANTTNLSDCANIDIVSLTNASSMPHVETDANGIIKANFVQSPTDKQTNVDNSGQNVESEYMEVDGIKNVGVDTDNGSHFSNVGINHSKNKYLLPNDLVSNSFVKQTKASVIETPKIVKEKESLFKYDALDTYMNKDKNIFYAEHAQQTSQRLLDFCENNKQTTTLFPSVSLYPAIVEPNAMLKQNDFSIFNPIERFNINALKPSSTERTKVIKRTCLTLDEIQEAFANSNASGNPENICSLPFLSGDFRLSVCISEETLNISVLKVVESDSFPGNKSKTLLLSEKNIQTSNNNTPIPSPTAILPSSNVESEASQPENQQKGVVNMKTTNPFPFLSEYFSDSESTEQVTADTKEAPLNDSEVFPFVEPVSGSSEPRRQNEEMACESAVDENVSPLISVAVCHPENVFDNLPATQPYKGDAEIDYNLKDRNKELFSRDVVEKDEGSLDNDKASLVDINIPKSPKSPDVLITGEKSASLVKEMNAEPLTMASHDLLTADNDKYTEKTSASKKTVTVRKSLTKGKTSQSPQVLSKSDSKSQRVLNEKKSIGSNNKSIAGTKISENISYFDAANSKSYQQLFDDSEDFSSDPDMAFAMELVAPLKNIAEQIKSTENKEKSKDDLSTRGFSFSLKEKNPMETFEELVLSKNKDSNVSQKPSRLSLKSKRSSKKFKRIKTCDSDDDSDVSESSKNESMFSTLSKNESSKEKVDDKHEDTSNYDNLKNSSLKPSNKTASPNDGNLKSHDMPYESLQDNSTFNSCISEDMTNNSSDIAMEIEDLDQKILSVVEKLKQCGREDLLNQEKLKLLKSTEKAPTKSHNKEEDCQSSFDSEDSTDIFSQSVPPTPPDATSNNNDSGFKASMYGHK